MFVSRIVKAGSDLAVCVVNLLDCYRYRNKRRDFEKRVTLIAGIYNYQN